MSKALPRKKKVREGHIDLVQCKWEKLKWCDSKIIKFVPKEVVENELEQVDVVEEPV